MGKGLFAKKSIQAESREEDHQQLKRHLKTSHLTAIGIGAIIGAGIFVIVGQAAAQYAGPSIVLSFILAALICFFAGLCFAELSSMIPVSGGSYSYAYVAIGELPAWIIGWLLIAQYLVSLATVAVGWSGYFTSFLRDFGVPIPLSLSSAPISYDPVMGWGGSGAILNIPAILVIILVGLMISIGIRAAAHFNNAMVAIKLSAIVLFVCLGLPYIKAENWIPFIPENTGHFGEFGWSGIVRASGLVFFAYIGFDTVATLAQDAVKPQRDLPKGILGSLGICTIAYIVIALVLTGVANYKVLGVPDPMAVALNVMGAKFFWLKLVIKLAIIAALTSVILAQSLGLTRILLAVSRDGLLPHAFAKLHYRLRTPLFSTAMICLISIAMAAFFPVGVLGELVSMITLFLFAIVCLTVLILRKTHPNQERPFKVPFVPLVPLAGIATCLSQMGFLPFSSLVQFLAWLVCGFAVYFLYSHRHSKLRRH